MRAAAEPLVERAPGRVGEGVEGMVISDDLYKYEMMEMSRKKEAISYQLSAISC
jgi:hypothetical protein